MRISIDDHEQAATSVQLPTPALVIDLGVVRERVDALRAALPGFEIHYAVKANPTPHLLATLAALGVGFDVASETEARLVVDGVGASPETVIYAHPIKPSPQLAAVRRLGVRRFAVDGVDELDKIARCAPGAEVFVRMAPTACSTAVLPLDGKFGVAPLEVAGIVASAIERGLEPVGVSFHVGSQACDPAAWARAIDDAAVALDATLVRTGRRLGWLDIGGGFPSQGHPGWPAPDIGLIGAAVRAAWARLPWEVAGACEPGRYLVGDAGVLHTSVIGTASRGAQRWAYLDAGVFHGLSEVLDSYGGFPFTVSAAAGAGDGAGSGAGGSGAGTVAWVLAGPSCDSADRLRGLHDLPPTLREGDRLRVGSAGAYSVALTTDFNGFAPLRAWTIDGDVLTDGADVRVLAASRA